MENGAHPPLPLVSLRLRIRGDLNQDVFDGPSTEGGGQEAQGDNAEQLPKKTADARCSIRRCLEKNMGKRKENRE